MKSTLHRDGYSCQSSAKSCKESQFQPSHGVRVALPVETQPRHRVNHAGDFNPYPHNKISDDSCYSCHSCSSEDLSEGEQDRRLSNWFDCWDVFDYFSQIQMSKYVKRVERDMGRPPNDSEMRYIRKVTTADWEGRPLEERRRYRAELTDATARKETDRERDRVARAAERTRDWLDQHFSKQQQPVMVLRSRLLAPGRRKMTPHTLTTSTAKKLWNH